MQAYLGATPETRDAKRKELIAAVGGAAGVPPKFLEMVNHPADLGQFFSLVQGVTDTEARAYMDVYVRSGINSRNMARINSGRTPAG